MAASARNLGKCKNCHNSAATFSDIQLKFSVLVAENKLHDVLQVQTDTAKYVFKTLPITTGVNHDCLLAKYIVKHLTEINETLKE